MNLKGYDFTENIKIAFEVSLNTDDEDEVIGIKEAISNLMEQWQDCDKPIKIEIVDGDKKYRELEEMFNDFWSEYPRKTDKVKAFKAFKKVCKDRQMLKILLAALAEHRKTKQWQTKEFIPHAATWLNGRRWEDDLTSLTDKPTQQASYDLEAYKRESLCKPLVYEKKGDRKND